MLSFHRRAARAAGPSVLVAALALAGVQAATQPADAAPKRTTTVAACTAAQTKLTVTPVTRPINHLLLKATNTGTKPCNAYGAPFLRAGADAQAALPWNDISMPQAVVVLAPGASAYAGIATYAPDGAETYTAKTLGVSFAQRDLNGSAGTETTVRLPHGGVTFNSAASVSYWQDNVEDALS
ncbi:DUF4232 domain-containing protein [Streptomyces galbus]|uniref:DUF4232 domain-containing protein n=1 Tax=Streptomyces galbus TaxID=33898 RepID=UPI003814E06D